MKRYITIIILIASTVLANGQNSYQLIVGRWNIQKNPNYKFDLFSSKYSFEFHKDNSFKIFKPVDGTDDSLRLDESGEFKLSNDSIEIVISHEDGIALEKPQIVKCKIIKLTRTELILQWPELINEDGLNDYPELRFIKA